MDLVFLLIAAGLWALTAALAWGVEKLVPPPEGERR